jgi:hypothetical protein
MKKWFLLFLLAISCQSIFAQNVGVGTNTPAFKLDVQGRMRVKTGTLNNVNTSSGIWFDDYRDGSNRIFIGMQDSIRWGLYGSGTGGVGWTVNFNAKTGNLGIGRTASAARLEIDDPAGGDIAVYSDNKFGGRIRSTDTSLLIQAAYGTICIPDPCPAKHIILQPPSTSPITGEFPGNVGIGIHNPTDKLEVKGDLRVEASSNSAQANIRIIGGENESMFFRALKNVTTPAQVGYLGFYNASEYSVWGAYGGNVYLTKDGNFGIENSTPDARLHITTGQDVGIANTANGFIMLGSPTSSNIIIDNNEIGFRVNGAWGELALQNDGGSVRIGNVALPSGYVFGVKGKAICEELKVQLSGNWPDYVFNKNYKLKSFDELRRFIAENSHLPNIPAAAEVEKNGLEVGDMQKRMMEKIEELTLYVLQLEERMAEMKKVMNAGKIKF